MNKRSVKKHTRWAIPILFQLLCIFLAASCNSAHRNWEVVLKTDIKTTENSAGFSGVNIAGFNTEKNGISVGHHGETHYTLNGGKTWTLAEYPTISVDLDSIDILDDRYAWASGGGAVRFTKNGGKLWEKLPDFGGIYNSGRYLSFIDDKNGWFGVIDSVFSTCDGGRTWLPIQIPAESIGYVMAVQLLSANTGYVLSNNGKLFCTTDAGKSWKTLELPLRGRQPAKYIPVTAVEAIRFRDQKNGTLVLYAEQPAGFYILQTNDGGQTWQEESLPADEQIVTGSIYLSHDGKFLTINDKLKNHIVLFRHTDNPSLK